MTRGGGAAATVPVLVLERETVTAVVSAATVPVLEREAVTMSAATVPVLERKVVTAVPAATVSVLEFEADNAGILAPLLRMRITDPRCTGFFLRESRPQQLAASIQNASHGDNLRRGIWDPSRGSLD